MTGEAPTDADRIYVGMALVQALPIKLKWKELADTISRSCNSSIYIYPASVQIIMDTHGNNQIKEMTQRSRGTSRRRIFVSNEGQAMTQNTNYSNDLLNIGDKQKIRRKLKLKLIKLIHLGSHTF